MNLRQRKSPEMNYTAERRESSIAADKKKEEEEEKKKVVSGPEIRKSHLSGLATQHFFSATS